LPHPSQRSAAAAQQNNNNNSDQDVAITIISHVKKSSLKS
jgi:hypothetical protein